MDAKIRPESVPSKAKRKQKQKAAPPNGTLKKALRKRMDADHDHLSPIAT